MLGSNRLKIWHSIFKIMSTCADDTALTAGFWTFSQIPLKEYCLHHSVFKISELKLNLILKRFLPFPESQFEGKSFFLENSSQKLESSRMFFFVGVYILKQKKVMCNFTVAACFPLAFPCTVIINSPLILTQAF